MKKNIIILILILSNFFFIIYAFMKADEASKSGLDAQMQPKDSEKLRDEAVALTEIAQKRAAEALNAQAQAEKYRLALEACKSK